jgi:hypothetical protein
MTPLEENVNKVYHLSVAHHWAEVELAHAKLERDMASGRRVLYLRAFLEAEESLRKSKFQLEQIRGNLQTAFLDLVKEAGGDAIKILEVHYDQALSVDGPPIQVRDTPFVPETDSLGCERGV